MHIAPHNPWFALHYATTGLNVLGQQINPGQQISRQLALHGYTRGAAWYLNRENELGSIEKGKFADLVVLDRDYFRVSDAEMRRIRPILTVVDGKVVHNTGVLHVQRRPDAYIAVVPGWARAKTDPRMAAAASRGARRILES